jgi:hypothetical protein
VFIGTRGKHIGNDFERYYPVVFVAEHAEPAFYELEVDVVDVGWGRNIPTLVGHRLIKQVQYLCLCNHFRTSNAWGRQEDKTSKQHAYPHH